jgi:hypothetical protein
MQVLTAHATAAVCSISIAPQPQQDLCRVYLPSEQRYTKLSQVGILTETNLHYVSTLLEYQHLMRRVTQGLAAIVLVLHVVTLLCGYASTIHLFVSLKHKDTLPFYLARQPPVGQGLLIHEVSRSHTTTHHIR